MAISKLAKDLADALIEGATSGASLQDTVAHAFKKDGDITIKTVDKKQFGAFGKKAVFVTVGDSTNVKATTIMGAHSVLIARKGLDKEDTLYLTSTQYGDAKRDLNKRLSRAAIALELPKFVVKGGTKDNPYHVEVKERDNTPPVFAEELAALVSKHLEGKGSAEAITLNAIVLDLSVQIDALENPEEVEEVTELEQVA